MAVIGALFGGYPQLYHDDFINLLQDQGHVVHARYGDGDAAKLTRGAEELVDLAPSVSAIVTADTLSSRAAVAARDSKNRTDGISIVMAVVSNVYEVWGSNIPTNALALSDYPVDEGRSGIRLRMLIELLTNTANQRNRMPDDENVVAVLVNAENPGVLEELERTEEAGGHTLPKVKVQPLRVSGRTDRDIDGSLGAALSSIDRSAVALIVIPEPVLFQRRERILEFARQRQGGLPDFWGGLPAVKAGGLAAWGAQRPDVYAEAAKYVAQIAAGTLNLRGKPLDLKPLPKTSPFVNVDTAASLRIAVPAQLQGLDVARV